MIETFRIRKVVKYQAMLLTSLFLFFVIASSSIFFLQDPAGHGFKREHSVAVVGGMCLVVFGSMLLLSIYLWVASCLERVAIDGSRISIRSVFQNCQFDCTELMCLKWRVRPVGGSIVLRSPKRKAWLDFHGYSKDDRLRMIAILQDRVPAEVQQGWPMFCHKIALPLRDGEPSAVRTEPAESFLTIKRKRYDWMFAFGVPISTALAIVLWNWTTLSEFFALPLLVVAAWLMLRFSVPRQGHVEIQVMSTSAGRATVLMWSAVIASQVAMIGLIWMAVESTIACWVGAAILLAAFPPFLYANYQSDKRQRIADEHASQLAPHEWRLD